MSAMKKTPASHVWVAVIAVLGLAGAVAAAPLPADLRNGSIVPNLAGRAGTEMHFRIYVPAGATSLEVATSGGAGDCDLYVARKVRPTPRHYHARSVGPTNNDRVRLANPAADWWHILVYGAGTYSGVTLRVRLGTTGGPVDPGILPLTNNVVQYGVSGRQGQKVYFRIIVPAGAKELVVTTSGGAGDCDLYVSRQSLPTRRSNTYRSTGPTGTERIAVPRPTPGTWYILLYGYSAFRDLKVLATYGQAVPPRPQPGIVITAPTGGVAWRVGGTHTIGWRTSPGMRYVSIEFSRDDGRTWTRGGLPVRVNAADGQYRWKIPFDLRTYVSSTARIRLTGTGRRGRAVTTVSNRFQIVPIWGPGPHFPPPVPPRPPRPPRGGRRGRDAYEDDNQHSRAKRINVGETQARTLYPEKDVDWLVCPSPGGGRFSIRVTDVTETIDIVVWIPQPGGRVKGLVQKEIDDDSGTLHVVIPPGIPYFYVKIDCDDDDDEGRYRVTILKR